MKEQENKILQVLDMNSEGIGICKDNGMVIFVPGTVTGDTIEAEILSVEKNYAKAACRRILTGSPYRREPECPCYQTCGGCTLGHVTREKELNIKENTVRQAFRRMHLAEDDSVFRPIRAGKETGYRNKAVFHADERGTIGYYARESHNVVGGSPRCRLLPEIFQNIAITMETCLEEWPGDLPLKSLYLRRNEENKCAVCLETKEPLNPKLQDTLMFYTRLLYFHHGKDLAGVLHFYTPKGKYAVPEFTVLSGERYLYENFNGLTMRLSPEGFCQVNHEGAEILADTVLQFAKMKAGDGAKTVSDLYCGSGFFGLQLAKAFTDWQVYGIEINPESIKDAEVNKALNRLENITFTCGDAAEGQKKIGRRPDFLVIDPPRSGCSPAMCRQITEIGPEHIAYVSCSPHTLARDLSRLCTAYRIESVQPVDMFPGTEHVETVVLMSKRG